MSERHPSKAPIRCRPFHKANTATPAATTRPAKLVAMPAAAPVWIGGLEPVAVAALPTLAVVLSEVGTLIEPVGYTIELLAGMPPVEATALPLLLMPVPIGPIVAEDVITGFVVVVAELVPFAEIVSETVVDAIVVVEAVPVVDAMLVVESVHVLEEAPDDVADAVEEAQLEDQEPECDACGL